MSRGTQRHLRSKPAPSPGCPGPCSKPLAQTEPALKPSQNNCRQQGCSRMGREMAGGAQGGCWGTSEPWCHHGHVPLLLHHPAHAQAGKTPRRRVPLTFVGNTEARGVLLPGPGGVRLRQQGAEQEGSQRQPAPTGSPHPCHCTTAELLPSAERGENWGNAGSSHGGGQGSCPAPRHASESPPGCIQDLTASFSAPPRCRGGAGGRAGCCQVRTKRHFWPFSCMSCTAAALTPTLMLCFQPL